MAVRIRLQRKGARHMAFFRIVVADSRAPRDGRFIEQLGYYDPLRDPAVINVESEKAIGWLGKGAQPSETVRALFSRIGLMETWHEMKKGRSYDELAHIEEDARKKIEAKAVMDRRKKEEKKGKKQAEAEKGTEEVAAPVSDAPADETPAEADAVAETEAETSDESGEAAVDPAEGEAVEKAPVEEPEAKPEPVASDAADEQGSAEGDETKTDA